MVVKQNEDKRKSTAGEEIYKICKKLYPLNRFLIGEGVRQTLGIIKEYLPELNLYDVPTGTKVFDWTVPKEWIIREAYIENEKHEKIIDFHDNNLHIVAYSDSIDKWMSLNELKQYIYVSDKEPDAIPYITSYYKERIGMCMAKEQLESLPEGLYHIVIESEKIDGNMSYGDLVIKGEEDNEIIIHSVICHPSLANDEISGVCLAIYLALWIERMRKRRYTYRFVFVPETIGAIAYLSFNYKHLKEKCIAGYILSCEGDNLEYSYVPTINGNTLADRVALKALNSVEGGYRKFSFLDRGSDERQYNAPGIEIPICLVCRSKAGEFAEYHTSKDNLSFVSPEGFQGSYDLFFQIISLLEMNRKYKSNILCEPQLGNRGLYSDLGCVGSNGKFKNIVDFLMFCDGKRDLIEISNILNISIEELRDIVVKLLDEKLICEKE